MTPLSRHGRPKPLRRRSPRARELQALDTIAKECVLLRDGPRCRWCMSESKAYDCGPLHCHHIRGKGAHPSMRYELLNLILLGSYHHLRRLHGADPYASVRWMEEQLGKLLLDHLDLMTAARKGQRTDLKLVRLLLEQERERLMKERRSVPV